MFRRSADPRRNCVTPSLLKCCDTAQDKRTADHRSLLFLSCAVSVMDCKLALYLAGDSGPVQMLTTIVSRPFGLSSVHLHGHECGLVFALGHWFVKSRPVQRIIFVCGPWACYPPMSKSLTSKTLRPTYPLSGMLKSQHSHQQKDSSNHFSLVLQLQQQYLV